LGATFERDLVSDDFPTGLFPALSRFNLPALSIRLETQNPEHKIVFRTFPPQSSVNFKKVIPDQMIEGRWSVMVSEYLLVEEVVEH
jgi:hypothetical protein